MDADKILSAYMAADGTVKTAIQSVLSGEPFILANVKTVGNDRSVQVDWQADQHLSIAMIMGLIQIGSTEFGDTWLRTLKSELNK